MHTEYRLWRKPGQEGAYQPQELYLTSWKAAAAADISLHVWKHNASTGDWHIDTPADAWIISAEQVPDNDQDRIALAVQTGINNAEYSGDHHKLWVIDQMLRHLLGDNYRATVGDNWDPGVAP